MAPGLAVPLHPEAAAFADHYGFTIDVLAAYRPTGKGRVGRQVNIVRNHVIAGRSFDSIRELDGAFDAWLPIRRSQVHRTHGQVIAVRAQVDRAALRGLPDQPYLVAEKHLRRVGKDLLDLLRGQLLPRFRPGWSGPGNASSCRFIPTQPVTGSASTPWASTAAECGEPGSYSPHSFDPRMVRRHGVSAGWSGSGSRGARKVDRVQVSPPLTAKHQHYTVDGSCNVWPSRGQAIRALRRVFIDSCPADCRPVAAGGLSHAL